MRRVRQNLLKTYYLRKHKDGKDDSGNTFPVWSDAVRIKAVIRKASGRLAVEQYGERTQYILKMQYDGAERIAVGDGVCVHVEGTAEPDFQVIAISELTPDTFRVFTLEEV